MIQCVLRWNNERLYKVELENGKSFTVGSGKNDTLFVEELLPGQLKFTYKKGALYASGKKLRDLYTEAIRGSATLQRITDELPLTICWQEAGEAAGQKYTLPYRGVVTIGRKDENNIVLDEGTVSGYQMTLRCEEGMAYLEDGGHNRQSTNGTYLNGHRIQKAKLKSGDIIDLLHLRIEVKTRNSSSWMQGGGCTSIPPVWGWAPPRTAASICATGARRASGSGCPQSRSCCNARPQRRGCLKSGAASLHRCWAAVPWWALRWPWARRRPR